MGNQVYHLIFDTDHTTVRSATQLHGILCNGVVHRLDVGRRTADDAKDLRRRCLLLQRLGKISIPRLQLLEKTGILDSDDGLICKGLEQGNLFVGKRFRLTPPDADRSDWVSFPKHRNHQGTPVAYGSGETEEIRPDAWIGLHIRHMCDRPFENCPGCQGPSWFGNAGKARRNSASASGVRLLWATKWMSSPSKRKTVPNAPDIIARYFGR